jgi:hypothetical protein
MPNLSTGSLGQAVLRLAGAWAGFYGLIGQAPSAEPLYQDTNGPPTLLNSTLSLDNIATEFAGDNERSYPK